MMKSEPVSCEAKRAELGRLLRSASTESQRRRIQLSLSRLDAVDSPSKPTRYFESESEDEGTDLASFASTPRSRTGSFEDEGKDASPYPGRDLGGGATAEAQSGGKEIRRQAAAADLDSAALLGDRRRLRPTSARTRGLTGMKPIPENGVLIRPLSSKLKGKGADGAPANPKVNVVSPVARRPKTGGAMTPTAASRAATTEPPWRKKAADEGKGQTVLLKLHEHIVEVCASSHDPARPVDGLFAATPGFWVSTGGYPQAIHAVFRSHVWVTQLSIQAAGVLSLSVSRKPILPNGSCEGLAPTMSHSPSAMAPIPQFEVDNLGQLGTMCRFSIQVNASDELGAQPTSQLVITLQRGRDAFCMLREIRIWGRPA